MLVHEMTEKITMHILFLHSNFPAQFGQIASHLVSTGDFRCTFVNEKQNGLAGGIECIRYEPQSGASPQNHFCSATFENQVGRSHAVYETLADAIAKDPHRFADLQLIVAHSGFVSPLFLSEVFPEVPVIGYFEYFYHRHNSDFDFRKDLPPQSPIAAMRMRARNAMLLLDLNHCAVGYCPTEFQRSQFPAEYQAKLRTIFDGIDCDFWKPIEILKTRRVVAGVSIPDHHQVITFVSRGFESMRGGDIFLRVIDQVCRQRSDVTVLVVGEDRVAYGGDGRFTGNETFRQWSIQKHQLNLDLDRVHFVGRVSPGELVRVFSASDVHLYWTVPFVLSWSVLNAMACGCAIVGSATEPVLEMIHDRETGRTVDFFDVGQWVDVVLELLSDRQQARQLGVNARKRVETRYSLPICLEKMRLLYAEAVR